ncbi:glycoside hydrolase family 13 protein [Enterococcus mediterraneensis]|uniref:glycoside hydrolase family 13 protein n=1 Tax=Enterococcus mediterraneensis TaxID=2364791 RepID=UPI000F06B1AB|nr:glycoside hydrolase family 13 protein [Enterococcus mediterraneensis]
MITSAIYHRPDSEFAYLYKKDLMHIRIRTARGDIKQVNLLHGDSYSLHEEKFYQRPLAMTKYLSTDLYDYWVAETKEKYNRMSYAFEVIGFDGIRVLYGDHGVYPFEEEYLTMPNNYFKMPYFHEADRFKAPEWVKETVWYQIFPERFANGDPNNDPEGTLPWASKDPDRQDFFGGDLQGVIDHLDHLVDLGINGIYFCPIFKAHSNHKYDTIDYLEIDPAFGDKELFKQLVEECHKRGIKVMLDAVFNHLGDTSMQWQDVIKNGADSRYADWFHIHEFPVSYKEEEFEHASDITYDVFAFTPHMPKLNTANPEVKAHLLNIAKYWIEEFDIDAWRLDVANEVDHQFWKEFRKVCDETKKDFYILGEIWHSSQSWLQGDEFHAVMNYAYTDAIMEFFVKNKISMSKMISEINSQLMMYRQQTNETQFNVLDSHDTPRLLTEANGNKDLMKQVLAFTYMQPGVPCVYYGDEFSMTGGMDPDCRKCMDWEGDQEMFRYFQKLIHFRKNNHLVFSEGTMVWQKIVEEVGLLELERELAEKQIGGIFNTGDLPQQAALPENILLSNLTEELEGELLIKPNGFVIFEK